MEDEKIKETIERKEDNAELKYYNIIYINKNINQQIQIPIKNE